MYQLLYILLLFVVGYTIGTITEKRHYANIRKREQATIKLPVLTTKQIPLFKSVEQSQLVTGNVAVSMDYFKRIVMALKSFFGGRLVLYETLVDRGRREAILRMKEQAPWADMIVNLRLETSAIGGQGARSKKSKVRSIEMFAYGTAIKFQKEGS
jgi:uncharacterized protein YbjQ (UPF0145 family)